jgi:hypothetical protein
MGDHVCSFSTSITETFKRISISISLGDALDDRGVRIPVGVGNFSLRHLIQTGSGSHPASYSMGTRGSFHGDKAAGA